jgi:ribulose 1,5-bisphosphate carboxylase large subunit-like protein
MTKEKMKQTINTITHLDSMKAVKVAFDLSESNQDSITKIMQVVHGNVNNINLLAERIAELEKKLEAYERPKN